MSKKTTRTLGIVVFGSAAVGKTALIHRYVTGAFIDRYDPTLDDEKRVTKIVDDVICTVNIQDTCGTDQFETVRELYVRNCEGAILVCNANNPTTLIDLPSYYETVKQFKNEKDRLCVVVVNKIDLEIKIKMEEAQKYAQSINAPCIQTSAKTNENVTEAFSTIIRRVLERKPPKKQGGCSIL